MTTYQQGLHIVVKSFVVVFGVILTLILAYALTDHPLGYSPLLLSAITLLFLVTFYALFSKLLAIPHISDSHAKLILTLFTISATILSMIISAALYYAPRWDHYGILFSGYHLAHARTLSEVATDSYGTFERYLARFPQQWGGANLYRLIFLLNRFLLYVNSPHMIVSFFNTLGIQLSVICTFHTLQILRSNKHAVFSLGVFALFLPFTFLGAAHYTHSLAMPFITGSVLLYIKYDRAVGKAEKLKLAIFLGILLALATLLVASSAIVLIAIISMCLLKCLLSQQPYKQLRFLIIPVVALLAFQSIATATFENHVSQESLEELQTPLEAWLMIGLSENGSFSAADARIYRAATLEERRDLAREEWLIRLENLGFTGFLALSIRKGAINFVDGTFQLNHFIRNDSGHQLHTYIQGSGAYFSVYAHLATAWIVALWVVVIGSAFYSLKKYKHTLDMDQLFLLLIFFGFFLFLSFWESGSRIVLKFMPLLVLLAVLGMDTLFAKLITNGDNINEHSPKHDGQVLL